MDPAFFVAYLSITSAAIPLLVMANRWRLATPEIRSVAMIAASSLLCDVIALMLSTNGINSLLLGNGFQLLQVALLLRIFAVQSRSTKPFMVAFSILLAVYLINTLFFQGPWKLNTAFLAVSSFVMILLSLRYFYILLTELPTADIHRLPMLWISFATLFYYSGNLFQFLTTNYILEGDMGAARVLWILHNLLNILKNILFTIAIWQSYRRTSSSLS